MNDLVWNRRILSDARVVAIVGLSPKEVRPSNQVARYLLARGYQVIPINPGHARILDLTCYPDLITAARALSARIDIVDIFRRSDQVQPVVEDAITIGAACVWMQEGVVNQAAAQAAKAAGLEVVMDLCIKTAYQQLWPVGPA